MNDNALVADIEGYASVFNKRDLNNDIIAPGAFKASLAVSLRDKTPIRMLYQHAAQTPIGRWTHLREDARGLYVQGELLLSSVQARDVYALLKGGALDGLSIGYQTARARKTKGARLIVEASLWEISIVTFPMAPSARITRIGDPRPSTSAPARSPSASFARHHGPLSRDGSGPNRRASVSPPADARHSLNDDPVTTKQIAEAFRQASQRLSV